MNAPIQSPLATRTTGASAASSTQQSPTNFSIPAPAPVQPKGASTDPFLKDFTLVAEAAKRAQVAVMMRDFENVGLS